MKFAEYTFSCRFETQALLAQHKGSCIRGLFGHCLKKVACAQRQSECGQCLLRSSCVYYQIFESPSLNGPMRAGNNVKPHPFVLVPPTDTKMREYTKGDAFDITFKLFGNAIDWLPYFVFCVEKMGKIGLGARTRQGWGRFRLDSVTYDGRQIYTDETRMLEQSDSWKILDVQKIQSVSVNSVEVFFTMPLRLKQGNRLTDSVDFQTLIRACCRRVAMLEEAFGKGEPELDYRDLVRQAAEVQTVESDTRWEQVFRYSNRQKTRMNIGGVVGRMKYQGNIAPFWPLLKYGEAVHIGKQTTFGNGRIAVLAS